MAAGAASYEYCYDTTNDEACAGSWVSTGTATSGALSGLAHSTTFYWQVRAVNGFGTNYANGGVWWTLTTGAAGPVLVTVTFRSAAAYDGWVLERDEESGKGSTFDSAGVLPGWVTTPRTASTGHPGLRHGDSARRSGDHRGHPEDQAAGA